mmetsp:Transcript_40626/g.114959  ORF Transcript_40626/g.114959 Transcript_40626/m.114959 type:complete len:101 (-) Transcript_40626:190-492(-)
MSPGAMASTDGEAGAGECDGVAKEFVEELARCGRAAACMGDVGRSGEDIVPYLQHSNWSGGALSPQAKHCRCEVYRACRRSTRAGTHRGGSPAEGGLRTR